MLTLPPDEVAAPRRGDQGAPRSNCTKRLKVDFPVYALFTKADLVVGFMEFFGDLDEKRRAQVFGATFQTQRQARKSMLAHAPAEFEALIAAAVAAGARPAAGARRTPPTASLLFGFPAQMAALQAPVIGFLNAIFDPAVITIKAALRGFYFTSGTQQGTPIDQLLGALAKGFGAEAVATPAYSGQGKSFFLTDLIRKVIIGEAGWVSTGRRDRFAPDGGARMPLHRRAAARRRLVAQLMRATSSAFATARRRRRNTPRPSRGVERGRRRRRPRPQQGAAGAARIAFSARRLWRPTGARRGAAAADLGLNQTARLRSAANTAYGAGLERMLRPRLIYRLEEQIAGRRQ